MTHQRPARVFIVRHGERKDHVDPQYHVGNIRPHDSPLTDQGKVMAQLLGQHLVNKRGVNPGFVASSTTTTTDSEAPLLASKVIVLTSPLQRCVETSHGICSGILAATGAAKGSIVPMYLETGIMEGPQWLNYDMEKARLIKIEHLAGNPKSTDHKHIDISLVVQPHADLKAIVGTEHLMAPRPDAKGLPGAHPVTGGCVVPASLEARAREKADQEHYNRLNHRAKSRHGSLSAVAAEFDAFQKEHVIVEDGEARKYICRGRVHERTEELARIIGGSDMFAGMDVILVGHGETTALVNNSFPNLKPSCEFHGSPYYTAWTELVYSNGVWATAEGVQQFQVPHLTEANVDTTSSGTG